ncbi:ABC transporter ATP-binding protein [Infirmifilum sp. NZ]|uniref:ABC transporter ATP-binding protein n=1 Tax=Infirmifilum sp. NZ TaxID=2926850 RepID=UPI00279B7623|nr:ABC transporter ATP-binding protein [Infirmifilum sp. NZ]UNQ73212.1 ABC transporter ATP-binding protein [Infirmifilum sp. NZ]
MVEVRVEGVTKSFGGVPVLKNVEQEAKSGQLVCILGPSGSGKSTLLKIIAGLIRPDNGRILFDGVDVTELPSWKRGIGYVFQNIALFSHLTVYDNIAFGMRLRKLPRDEIDRRIKNMLKLVKMEGFEKRKPTQLSGGQAQRVAIARALVIDPKVLLFDEPLGHLDAKLREELKYEIRRIQKETGKTAIYVTHDQSEAFAIADYIYILRDGKIEQSGTPIELYLTPKSPFVAEFVGLSNFISGKIISMDREKYLAEVDANGMRLYVKSSSDARVGDEVIVSVRPEDVTVIPNEDEASQFKEKFANILPAKVLKKVCRSLSKVRAGFRHP